ncbi:MAG: beta/gamma crystallin family protein [Clostridia bacterium]|nr:beta/gamma crystallin family protein [Clostridia bacterium]
MFTYPCNNYCMFPMSQMPVDYEIDRQTGPKIILFEHVNFSGRSLVVPTDIPDLRQYGFNDIVSSIIVIRGRWEIYEHILYGGRRYVVTANGGPFGDGTYPTWTSWGGVNDQLSSVRRR